MSIVEAIVPRRRRTRMARRARARARWRWDRSEQLTAGLAVLALGTAGFVMGTELVRMARRRARQEDAPETLFDTAEMALDTAGRATQDTVAVAIEGYEAAPRTETILFNLLSGFVLAFGLVRLTTHGRRGGWWPFEDVKLGGRHIHHFVPGILLAFTAGGAAILTDNDRLETLLAAPFGAGMGLTFDEAAMLLELKDVYWTREGILSVQVSLATAAILGATILAARMLRRGERRQVEAGTIPAG